MQGLIVLRTLVSMSSSSPFMSLRASRFRLPPRPGRWTPLVVAAGLVFAGCEDPGSSGRGQGGSGAGEAAGSSSAVGSIERSLFPESVDIEALDPAVAVHLADRLARVAEVPEDPEANAALADAWLAHDRAELAVEPARRAAVEGTPLDRVGRLVLLGDALAASGDIDGAIEAGRVGLSIAGEDANLHWRLAGWSFDAGDLDEARRLATRATSLAPGEPVPSRMLATILLADGRAVEAIRALAPFARDPRDGATQYLMSRALNAAGRPEEAEVAATLAGDTRPTFVDPWLAGVRATRVDLAARLSFALELASRGERDAAFAAVAALRPLYPDRRELDATVVGIHALANEHERVLELVEPMIAADPEWTIPRTRGGFAALALARRTIPPEPALLARAAADAEVLARLLPNDAEANDLLGRVRAAQGRWGEALVTFRRAMQLEPSQGRHRVAVGECLLMTGGPLEAEAVVDEMDRLFGRSVDAALIRVRAMAATGRQAEARGLLEQCRRAIPNHPGLILAERAVSEAGG